MSKFRKGNKVLVIEVESVHIIFGVSIGDVGYVEENSSTPYVRFDHVGGRWVPFSEERLQLVTGEESELEKLLFWNRVSK